MFGVIIEKINDNTHFCVNTGFRLGSEERRGPNHENDTNLTVTNNSHCRMQSSKTIR